MLIIEKHLQAVTKALLGKESAAIGELLSEIDKIKAENAAAPELLAACKCAIADFDYYESIEGDVPHHVASTMKELRAAIASATP